MLKSTNNAAMNPQAGASLCERVCGVPHRGDCGFRAVETQHSEERPQGYRGAGLGREMGGWMAVAGAG